uniref:Endonuclease/exonuclease/phosphatase domain-containing protein n=1 Tax=Ciona savignyi TaxID=51511 RepID=H2YKC6_CIOSA
QDMGGLCTCCRPQLPKDTSIKHHGNAMLEAVPVNHIPIVSSTIDINTATEEDLMTLPTVGRVVAHNIVEYRRKIGGFRKVEDLVLVNGIGAGKLGKMRKEIHVSESWNKLFGMQSLPSRVNINTAAAETICNISELSEDTAAKIIEYRAKNGPFHHINDLVEPANIIDITTLLRIKSKIATSDILSHSRQPSAASERCRNGSANNFPGFGPECIPSNRPKTLIPSAVYEGRPVVRIATWNLQQCSLDKAKNPGIKEVVCMTILENGIKILAVQELADKDALDEFVNELNNPTLPNIERLRPYSTWKSSVSSTAAGKMYQGSEYSGFLWDNSVVDLYSSALLEKTKEQKEFTRRPFLGYFKVCKVDLILVNLHMKAVGHFAFDHDMKRLGEEIKKLPEVLEALHERVPEEKDVFILGDFNLDPDAEDFDVLRKRKYRSLVPASVPTNISRKNMKGSRCYDNIWVSQSAAALYTSKWQVVRNGLTNPWIPDGWSWGGVASDHCPVWCQVFVDQD